MTVKHRLWITGTRVLAVVAASTAAFKTVHRPEIRRESGLNEGKDVILVEKWRDDSEPVALVGPRINRQNSFASTRSTCSLISYMRARGIFSLFEERTDFSIVEHGAKQHEDYGGSAGSSLIDPVAGAQSKSRKGPPDSTTKQYVHLDLTAIDGIEEGVLPKANESTEREEKHAQSQGDITLPSALHHQSVKLFTALAPYISVCPQLGNSSHMLLEDLGRLYLWGHDINDRRFDALLETSPELRSTVLELTTTISSILTTVVYPLLLVSSSDGDVRDQVAFMTEILGQVRGSLESRQEEVYESDDTDSDSEYDVDDAALVIRSSVNCLMGLLPSIEKSLVSIT